VKKIASTFLSISIIAGGLFTSIPLQANSALKPPNNTNVSVNGVRACLFVPGVSIPVSMPPGLINQPKAEPRPKPRLESPDATSSSAGKTQLQLAVLYELSLTVSQHYVYPDFRGHDWKVMTARTNSMIHPGMSDGDFYAAMQALVSELGDEHSYFQSPAEGKKKTAEQHSYPSTEKRKHYVSLSASARFLWPEHAVEKQKLNGCKQQGTPNTLEVKQLNIANLSDDVYIGYQAYRQFRVGK
jgi:hypothetical protein